MIDSDSELASVYDSDSSEEHIGLINVFKQKFKKDLKKIQDDQVYQIKVFSLFASRAQDKHYKMYSMKYDTVKFEGDDIKVFIQSRFKQHEILERDLTSMRGDFSFHTMFEAFDEISDGGIFLFCTNESIDTRAQQKYFLHADREEIIDIFGGKGTYLKLNETTFKLLRQTHFVETSVYDFCRCFRILLSITENDLDELNFFDNKSQWKAFAFDMWQWYGCKINEGCKLGVVLTKIDVENFISDIKEDYESFVADNKIVEEENVKSFDCYSNEKIEMEVITMLSLNSLRKVSDFEIEKPCENSAVSFINADGIKIYFNFNIKDKCEFFNDTGSFNIKDAFKFFQNNTKNSQIIDKTDSLKSLHLLCANVYNETFLLEPADENEIIESIGSTCKNYLKLKKNSYDFISVFMKMNSIEWKALGERIASKIEQGKVISQEIPNFNKHFPIIESKVFIQDIETGEWKRRENIFEASLLEPLTSSISQVNKGKPIRIYLPSPSKTIVMRFIKLLVPFVTSNDGSKTLKIDNFQELYGTILVSQKYHKVINPLFMNTEVLQKPMKLIRDGFLSELTKELLKSVKFPASVTRDEPVHYGPELNNSTKIASKLTSIILSSNKFSIESFNKLPWFRNDFSILRAHILELKHEQSSVQLQFNEDFINGKIHSKLKSFRTDFIDQLTDDLLTIISNFTFDDTDDELVGFIESFRLWADLDEKKIDDDFHHCISIILNGTTSRFQYPYMFLTAFQLKIWQWLRDDDEKILNKQKVFSIIKELIGEHTIRM
ncbi:CLUMA_CG005532, isoform A [Clunio marinus]|uniref:CLUMA_CG005532, isoform A n=1 Tax=Clunio marinus TaxID=568069 RepID=A0A1J1I0J6_9DIPT|nr:CLUMA_CG005532, isoform A [Clunio marinus]